MFEYLLKLLTPSDPSGQISPIIGYYKQGNSKKLAISRFNAIQAEVFGLEVVIGETHRRKQTNQGGQNLSEYRTLVYLTQRPGAIETIQDAVNLLYDTNEFYDQEVHWPETPVNNTSVRRACVTLFHRCECPKWSN